MVATTNALVLGRVEMPREGECWRRWKGGNEAAGNSRVRTYICGAHLRLRDKPSVGQIARGCIVHFLSPACQFRTTVVGN